jgi:hypothetical protein
MLKDYADRTADFSQVLFGDTADIVNEVRKTSFAAPRHADRSRRFRE